MGNSLEGYRSALGMFYNCSRKNLIPSTKTQVYVYVCIKQIYNFEENGG
jgi:hypothetical protein